MKTSRILFSALALCCLLTGGGCDRGRDEKALAGKYEAQIVRNGKPTAVAMVLRPDRKGEWNVEYDNAPFTWEKRNREIWLHTKTGGVIVGKLENGEIVFRLPGASLYRFRYKSESQP
jgi:hypothetical protein